MLVLYVHDRNNFKRRKLVVDDIDRNALFSAHFLVKSNVHPEALIQILILQNLPRVLIQIIVDYNSSRHRRDEEFALRLENFNRENIYAVGKV